MEGVISGFLLPGMTIGFASALSPGPLMALLFSETVRHGKIAGSKVAVAPLITDVPFIALAILSAKGIDSNETVLGALSLVGALFLAYLGITNIRSQPKDFAFDVSISASLWKGIATNLTNPHMYLYWFTIATPFFAQGGVLEGAVFAGALLLCSVGTMLLLVLGVSQARERFFDHLHWVLRVLGVMLLFFAMKFLSVGLGLIG
jgi:threonine/homoserine/homoserine lactone efflux protein